MWILESDHPVSLSDVISNCIVPLMPETHHIIRREKNHRKLHEAGVILVNVSRGGLIDTRGPLIEALEIGRLGGVALDVYEEKKGGFSKIFPERCWQDDLLAGCSPSEHVLINSPPGLSHHELSTTLLASRPPNLHALMQGGTPFVGGSLLN